LCIKLNIFQIKQFFIKICLYLRTKFFM